MNRKGRCWILTINMASEEDYEVFDPSEVELCKLAAWQLEMGESGTLHWQAYANFSESVRLAHIKRQPGLEGCHAELREGTVEEAVNYCTKLDTRLEGPFYWPSKQRVMDHAGGVGRGKRTDIDYLCDLVEAGKTDAEIYSVAPRLIARYSKGIAALRLAKPTKGRAGARIDSVVYWGPTGTGKSHRLRQECPEGPDWFWVSPGKWFDGYQGQSGLVFDEFRGSWATHTDMLKLVDIYPCRKEIKGSHVGIMATRFRFSSNEHPSAWYEDRRACPPWAEDPLRRRLRRVIYMGEPYVAPDEEPVEDAHYEQWLATRPPREAIGAPRLLYGERLDG